MTVMMKDVMIDLETMGLGVNAAIIAIGAVEFDLEAKMLGRTFYALVDLQSSVDAGGEIDPSTVMWWLAQSKEARSALLEEGILIDQALSNFGLWLLECGPDVKVWGNGADFDNVILAQAFRRSDFSVPWKFWNNRCFRTFKNMLPECPSPFIGIQHNALDDAKYQAEYLIAALHAMDTL